ncbi:MAG: hypothetical protein CFH33_01047 [Alphaproteobacteria bacterium MarineAlpha9_Bin3]|nr:MAG: hypothetical protein CFH33_01047 [Alphaproteobacteria bacterium MarineAlpha9_Bin3]|tara:strand:- start:11152 stop:12306 length:1155 start_codon:yes stop_codon:yes gene_type:complete
MIKKTSQQKKESIENIRTENLIKSLGGAQKIYKHLLSKNKNITIESIYKWKKNGIPYRYRADIKELSSNNNIKLMDDAFLGKKEINNKKNEISSNKNINTESIIRKNIALYLLIIISLFFIIHIFFNINNINKLEQKIINIEKTISTISSSDYKKEIDFLSVTNIEQNNLIKKNSSKINDLYTTNEQIKDLVNKIEPELSNILLKQNQTINSDQINSIYVLLYLIDIKNDIKFADPNLSQFNLIKDYLKDTTKPEYATLAFNNINKLSEVKLKSHKNILGAFHNKIFIINNPGKNETEMKKTLLDKFKSLVKISKNNKNTVFYQRNSQSLIINSINNHNYEQSIYALKQININGEYNKIIQDLNNLKILYESINIIIKWLIFEG